MCFKPAVTSGDRAGYHVHSIVSAHLNDVRTGVDWPKLFEIKG